MKILNNLLMNKVLEAWIVQRVFAIEWIVANTITAYVCMFLCDPVNPPVFAIYANLVSASLWTIILIANIKKQKELQ